MKQRQAPKEYIPNSPELASSLLDPYRYFDGAKFKEDEHCKQCGCALNDEVALVDGERWCHACADEGPLKLEPETRAQFPHRDKYD